MLAPPLVGVALCWYLPRQLFIFVKLCGTCGQSLMFSGLNKAQSNQLRFIRTVFHVAMCTFTCWWFHYETVYHTVNSIFIALYYQQFEVLFPIISFIIYHYNLMISLFRCCPRLNLVLLKPKWQRIGLDYHLEDII